MHPDTHETFINSARLTLAPFQANDLAALHTLWTDADVRRHLWDDEVIDIETVAEVIAESSAAWRERNIGMWCVRLHDQADLVGFVGFRFVHEIQRGAELLYGFYPRYWRKGYAAESVNAALNYAFVDNQLPHVWGATDPPNVASVRVMERAGFAFKEQGLLAGLDTLFFAMTAAQFAASRSTPPRIH